MKAHRFPGTWLAVMLLAGLTACGGRGGGAPQPTPTATRPQAGPAGLECPSFAAFGGLPIPLPAPIPVPGADVRGSPSPVSPLARAMDETLRSAFGSAGFPNPRRSCFFEIRVEERAGAFGIYEFPSPPGTDAGERLRAALQGLRVEATATTVTAPGGAMAMLELKYPDKSEGGLLLIGTMAWSWVAPSPEEATVPTVEASSPPPPALETPEAPPTVQPTGLAQEVDAVLRPALEGALETRLQLTDFAVVSMGAASQVHLQYHPEGTLALAGRGERLRQALGRIGLSGVMTAETPEGLTVVISEGKLADRSVQGGITIRADQVEVGFVLGLP